MDCDVILARCAELDQAPDADARKHLAGCEACSETLEAARSGRDALVDFERAQVPVLRPADPTSAWNVRRRRARHGAVRLLSRAAVILLAATGALALAGVKLHESEPAAPSLTRAEVEAMFDAAFAKLSTHLDERDLALATTFHEGLRAIGTQRQADVAAIARHLELLKTDIALLANSRGSAVADLGSLPDK